MPQQTIQDNATIVDPNFMHIIVINNNIKVAYVYRYMVEPLLQHKCLQTLPMLETTKSS